MKQRWYPAKDAGEPSVVARELFPFPCAIPAAVAVWEIRPPHGDAFPMFVPVAAVAPDEAVGNRIISRIHAGGAEHDFVEAFSRDEFIRSWVNYQLRGREESAPVEHLRSGRLHDLAGIDPATAEIRRNRVEQSNTSLRIGQHAIMKVIRKVEIGPHPELEIGRFLSASGFSATPSLLGWVELAKRSGNFYCTLSLLHRFVENSGDGWSWTLKQLNCAVNSQDRSRLEDLTRWIKRLAVRTAEMHRAFASDTSDPAFRPEPVTAEDFARWRSSAEAMASRAFHAIGSAPDAEGRVLATELMQRRDALLQQIRGLPDLPDTFTKTRHHGDFHLGQVLVAQGDAMILDFEGEPLRPIAERRAKHCVLRDVAGMLRSLSYAAATAAQSAPEREATTAMLDEWRERASRNFVESWFAAAKGICSIPADRSAATVLLDFFLLEKALYEISYEAANRPDWIAIPLRGVLSLLRK